MRAAPERSVLRCRGGAVHRCNPGEGQTGPRSLRPPPQGYGPRWFWHDSAACIDANANTQMFELRDKTNQQRVGFFFCVFFLKTPHSSTRVVFPDFLQRPVPGEQKRTGTAVQRGATLRKENDSAGLTAEGSVAEERPDKEEEEEKAAHTCVTLSGSPKTGVT